MTDPPAKLRTVCPHCRALLEVAAEFAGRPVMCGRCRQVFPAEGIQPNPPAPFPLREGGEYTLPPVGGDGSAGASAGLAPPSLLGKGAGALGFTPGPGDSGHESRRVVRGRSSRDRYDDFDDRPRRRRRTDGSATASLVLGIVSLVCFCVFPVSLTTGAIGAWLGVAGLKSRSRPLAVTGLTLSAVGIVFGLGFAVLFLAGIVKAVSDQPRLGPTRNNPTFNAR